jgi:hypothetical protein
MVRDGHVIGDKKKDPRPGGHGGAGFQPRILPKKTAGISVTPNSDAQKTFGCSDFSLLQTWSNGENLNIL